jgi:hypothetical protein
MKGIREETVAEAVPEQLFPLQFDEEEKAYVENKVSHLREHWRVEREQQIATVNLQLNQLQDRCNRLTDAYIDRLIERGIFENRKTALLREIKDLEEKRTELQSKAASVLDRLTEFLELAGSVYLQYEMALPEEKRDLLKIVTSNRCVDPKNVSLELHSPFDLVANRFQNTNGAPLRDRLRTWDGLIESLVKLSKAKLLETSSRERLN